MKKEKFKFKPGDLVSWSLKNSAVLFIVSCEDETEYCHAQYRYYSLAYPDNISTIDKMLFEAQYFKVNR